MGGLHSLFVVKETFSHTFFPVSSIMGVLKVMTDCGMNAKLMLWNGTIFFIIASWLYVLIVCVFSIQ